MKKLLVITLLVAMLTTVLTSCNGKNHHADNLPQSETKLQATEVPTAGATNKSECTHDYIERDGRVFCSICRKMCQHNYEKQGSDMYCSNCMYKCKHSFKSTHNKQICENCKLICPHDYAELNGVYICKICNSVCSHNYEVHNDKEICKNCGSEKIILTTKNVEDYLNITYRYEFVKHEKFTYSGTQYVAGKILVDVSPKQNVKFKDLKLKIEFTPHGNLWSSDWKFKRNMDIAYDGNNSFTFEIETPLIDIYEILCDSPIMFTHKIIELSGSLE